jgi:hypothetical protein
VTISAGVSTGTFTATANSVEANQVANVTASWNGAVQSTAVTLNAPIPASRFYLRGDATEVSSITNGATVTPSGGPAGFTGMLVVQGSGTVRFLPAAGGNGVSFGPGGFQNGNSAFYSFVGQPVGTVFNLDQGDLSFNLVSNYSFAQ